MSAESQIVLDEKGFPRVVFANVPNAGVSTLDTNAGGGNPRHDTASGKFGSGGGNKNKDAAAAFPNADPLDVKRMLDAARDAAREYDTPDEGDIREFLAGRAKNPAQVDIQGFLALVLEQKKTDLVDILDQQLRSGGVLRRGRRTIRVSAPRGYVQKTLRGLDDNAVAEILHRLEARGHDAAELEQHFGKRIKEDVHKSAVAKKNAIVASDDFIPPAEYFGDWGGSDESASSGDLDAIHLADVISRNIKPPVINLAPVINVEIPSSRKVIRRDPETLLVESIEDEDASADQSLQ